MSVVLVTWTGRRRIQSSVSIPQAQFILPVPYTDEWRSAVTLDCTGLSWPLGPPDGGTPIALAAPIAHPAAPVRVPGLPPDVSIDVLITENGPGGWISLTGGAVLRRAMCVTLGIVAA